MAKEKKAPGKALTNWSAQLAEDAKVAAEMEASTASGQFIGTQGGILTFNGQPFPKNEMAVVIMASTLANAWFKDKYDSGNPSGPACWAFGNDEKSMKPDPSCAEPQGGEDGGCVGCPMNEFGTADTGRGKACKNGRRLVILSAGSFDATGRLSLEEDSAHYEKGGLAIMGLPPTSIKAFAAMVKQLKEVKELPPHGVICRIWATPEQTGGFSVGVEVLQDLPEDLIPAVMGRRKEALSLLPTPYMDYSPPAARGRGPAPKGKARPLPGRAPAPRAAAPAPAARVVAATRALKRPLPGVPAPKAKAAAPAAKPARARF